MQTLLSLDGRSLQSFGMVSCHLIMLDAYEIQHEDHFTMLSGIAHDPIQRYTVSFARLPSVASKHTANNT